MKFKGYLVASKSSSLQKQLLFSEQFSKLEDVTCQGSSAIGKEATIAKLSPLYISR